MSRAPLSSEDVRRYCRYINDYLKQIIVEYDHVPTIKWFVYIRTLRSAIIVIANITMICVFCNELNDRNYEPGIQLDIELLKSDTKKLLLACTTCRNHHESKDLNSAKAIFEQFIDFIYYSKYVPQ